MTTMPTRALADLPDMARATNFSASDAKAKLGQMIDLVAAGGVATITRRGRQQFAVLRLETVEALVSMAREHELESLGSRYHDLVARMQTPKAKAAVDSLFSARPEDIGAAVAGAARGGVVGVADVDATGVDTEGVRAAAISAADVGATVVGVGAADVDPTDVDPTDVDATGVGTAGSAADVGATGAARLHATGAGTAAARTDATSATKKKKTKR
ncbi:MAG: type II toxin-antitoxin system prevent-host-death family antitoxin [Candidatus Binatia bacterium]